MRGRLRVVSVRQALARQRRTDLQLEIGLGLGGGPEGEKPRNRVHRSPATGGNPAVDHGGLLLHGVAQGARCQDPRLLDA